MMRKIIKRLFISAITFILLIVAIFISIIDIEEAIEPPKGAVRIGDLKDIYWLKKISVSHNSMRICIYNDYNGDLALDADFPIVHFNDTTLNDICSFYTLLTHAIYSCIMGILLNLLKFMADI